MTTGEKEGGVTTKIIIEVVVVAQEEEETTIKRETTAVAVVVQEAIVAMIEMEGIRGEEEMMIETEETMIETEETIETEEKTEEKALDAARVGVTMTSGNNSTPQGKHTQAPWYKKNNDNLKYVPVFDVINMANGTTHIFPCVGCCNIR